VKNECLSKVWVGLAGCKGIYIEGGKEGYEVAIGGVEDEALKKRGDALKRV
jgi:hypothetical protein